MGEVCPLFLLSQAGAGVKWMSPATRTGIAGDDKGGLWIENK